jgi:hypothetical protein
MFLVAVTSIASLHGLRYTRTLEQVDKESELLWVGKEYRNAIQAYYEGTPGSDKLYPQQLSDMLYDVRQNRPGRTLRKLYRDPMTSSADWGLVKNERGGIVGVFSKSEARPMKRHGFPSAFANFAGAQYYSQWRFIYQPK